MKITIESTSQMVDLNGVPARVWEGQSDSGIPVHCYITRVAVKEGLPAEAYVEFERELSEHRKPTIEWPAIPLRMIL